LFIGKEFSMGAVRTITAAMACIILLGCASSSPRGGGEAKGEGFKVVVPTSDVLVKQGETRSVTVSVQRDDYFKRDVDLDIKPTTGIAVEPASALVRASDKPDVQVRVSASRDAALGEYRVYVKGTPESGAATSVEFRVKVVAP
jgi:hypothetical protein